MEETRRPKYCFDTDTLASSWRRHYRPEAFGPLWERLAIMMTDGIILIPEEVKKEIGAGRDGLVSWLKKSCPNYLVIDDKQLEIVSEIVNKYPGVSHYKKPRANHADPFVVAVGKIYSVTVVTFESGIGGPTNPSIPALCKEYGVECCSMADFFDKEGFSFTIKG